MLYFIMKIIEAIIEALYKDPVYNKFTRKIGRYFLSASILICHKPYDEHIHNIIIKNIDPVRYATIALAINTIQKSKIEGAFAEVGVYKGDTSKFIHKIAPERELYLFDTFEGFPKEDMENPNDLDERFKDTSVEIVKKNIGDLNNIIIKKGYFPETTKGLENKKFAFVMLDVDKYKPTLAGLEFFYPRLNSGGYIFLHDYNSSESNYGVSRAFNKFINDKPEKFVEIPDANGTVVIRKI